MVTSDLLSTAHVQNKRFGSGAQGSVEEIDGAKRNAKTFVKETANDIRVAGEVT